MKTETQTLLQAGLRSIAIQPFDDFTATSLLNTLSGFRLQRRMQGLGLVRVLDM